MRISQWRGPGYRVTRAEDRFFSSPLSEMTLFRFETPLFEIEAHAGEFSVKLVLRGEEQYLFERRHVRLRPGQVLLVNAGEVYASVIDRPTESLSIFFRADEAAAIGRAVRESPEQLLLQPTDAPALPDVPQVAFSGSPRLGRRLEALIASLDERDPASSEERSRMLLASALRDAWRFAPPEVLAHVRRRATRDELIARISRARTLIDDLEGRGLSLDELAREACMSRYHFLRTFAQVVGETPLAYARRCRLECARQALGRGEERRGVARRAGYRSVRAFNRAYRKRFGADP